MWKKSEVECERTETGGSETSRCSDDLCLLLSSGSSPPPRPGPAAVTSHRWRANGSVNKRDVTRNGRRDWLRVPIPVLHEERGGGEPRGQLLCRLERREVCYCESSSWTSAHIWTGSSEEICDGGKSEETQCVTTCVNININIKQTGCRLNTLMILFLYCEYLHLIYIFVDSTLLLIDTVQTHFA